MCNTRLTLVVPPYATELGLATEMLAARGGYWKPMAAPDSRPWARVTLPGRPLEEVIGPYEGPAALARLICLGLIHRLEADQEDHHG